MGHLCSQLGFDDECQFLQFQQNQSLVINDEGLL